MIVHHKSTTYYPQGNGQVESTNKTLGKILAKLVDVNCNNWGTMFFTTLLAYRTRYKVITQCTHFELVYNTQHVILAKFMVLTKRIKDVPIEDLNLAIHVRMENFI
jgi:hypothetical protein